MHPHTERFGAPVSGVRNQAPYGPAAGEQHVIGWLNGKPVYGIMGGALGDPLDRTDAGALIPEDVSKEIITALPEQSAVLSRFRRVTMSRKQKRMPALSAFPVAYFVNGDTGLKQTTKLAWTNKFLDAEELAVIVAIPDAVIDDQDYDIWGEVRPSLVEALGRKLDAAVFFGTDAPAAWPDDIAAAAAAAGNTYQRGTNNAAAGGVAEDLNQTMATVEEDGFDVTGFVTKRGLRSALRGGRDTDGNRLLDIGANGDSVYGLPVSYGMSGLFPTGASAAELFAGDWSQFMVGVRQDLSFKIFTEGVISDDEGNVLLNLMQQDTAALRVVARFAWQVANPITHSQPTEDDRYPVGILTAPAGSGS